MRAAAVATALVALFLSPVAGAAEPVKLYAAGPLRAARGEIAKAYEAACCTPVVAELATSCTLRERIEAGDRPDLLASANKEHPARLASRIAAPVVRFTRNRLCALAQPDLAVTSATLLEVMLRPDVRVGTSTPKADPSGDNAFELFAKAEALRAGAKAALFLNYCTNAIVARQEEPSLQRLSQITSELQEGVMKTRMQPISTAWSKFPRLVRDLAVELDKKIELKMIGAETELDRQVLEMIKDPLTHMIRNSVDHGLEQAAVRRAAGKSEQGTFTLDAFHEGGYIVIGIADDGKGLDLGRIRNKALSQKLITEAEAAAMTPQQVTQLVFRAGLSTADEVIFVSGRGVGMAVVRANIEKIGCACGAPRPRPARRPIRSPSASPRPRASCAAGTSRSSAPTCSPVHARVPTPGSRCSAARAPLHLARWFTAEGSRYRVRPELARGISFRAHNLLEDPTRLGAFDIVFLRNVLIYFDVPIKQQVLGHIRKVLAPEGYLVLGGAETVLGVTNAFTPMSDAPGFYRAASAMSATAFHRG